MVSCKRLRTLSATVVIAVGCMLVAVVFAAPAGAAWLPHFSAALGRADTAAQNGPAWATDPSLEFQNIDIPGAAFTAANGVNNGGTVLGSWDNTGSPFGFGFIEQPGGQPITFNFPGTSDATAPSGINDVGTAVGAYMDSNGVPHGWVRSRDGSFTQLDDPLGVGGSSANQINDNGLIVGSYADASGVGHGFVYDHGTFTTLDFPGAIGTVLTGVNNSGAIVGGYTDALGVNHGFLYRKGTFKTIDPPDAGTSPGEGTIGLSISSNGVIAGPFTNDSGFFGFLLSKGQYSSLNDPNAVPGQSVQLNLSSNGRYACGEYFDASGVLHGYVATLTP
jgi:probable HAF family extracellular repeat protein